MTKIFIFIVIFSIVQKTFGQDKYGYIEYDKVVQFLPDYLAFQKRLETYKQHLEDSVNIKQKQIESFYWGIGNCYMDDKTKQVFEDSINNMNLRIEEYMDYARNKFQQEQKSIEESLKVQLIEAVNYFCAEKKIICLTDKQSMLYCVDCQNFTDEIIGHLMGAPQNKD